jgi:tetratricopeptide (TPR) repeat protein
MRKIYLFAAFAALLTVGFSSCKVFKGATVNCTPDPVEVHADSIRFQLKASVPPKSGMKKGGTYTGEAKFGSVSQGKVVFSSDKYPKVKKTGIDTTISFRRPFEKSMDGNSLLIKQDYERKGKTFELPNVENLCECCITTSKLVYEGTYLIFSTHNYVKEVRAERKAQFNFPKNVFDIQAGDYSKGDIVAIGDFLKKKYITKKVTIKGFASPEGPFARNTELSINRSKQVKTWLVEQLKTAGYDNYLDSSFFDVAVTYEDWDGFKASIQGQPYSEDVKKQIITLVSAGLDPNDLENKIMQLVGGKEKVEYILAPLRRATIEMEGFEFRRTDAEIDKVANDFIDGKLQGNIKDTFEKEEWMYAISRQDKPARKKVLLEAFRDAYSSDARAFNDLGVIALMENDADAGMNYLDKAYKLNTKDYAIQNNIGAAYVRNGKYKEAKEILENSLAGRNTPEASFNLGVVLEKMARYNMAIERFNAASSLQGAYYNAGLCKLLMGDVNGAKSSLEEAVKQSGDQMAMPYYVLAIAGAKSKDPSLMTVNLRKACQIDSSLKDKARKDLEFRNYWNNTEFKAAIGG